MIYTRWCQFGRDAASEFIEVVLPEKISRALPRGRLPPLNALRAFEVAARHLSIARAAEELGVTHGAISQHVRSLEAFLGLNLLERIGNRLKLTPDGAGLLGPLSAAFDQLTEAVARRQTSAIGGEVTLCAPPAFSTLWISNHVGQFLDTNPAVRLKLIPSTDIKISRAPNVDLSVRYGSGAWPDEIVEPLCEMQLFPVCSPALINSRPQVQDLEHLKDFPILCGDEGEEWNAWIATAGQNRGRIGARHFVGNALIAIEMSIAGFGLAMGDDISSSRYLSEGRLVRPFSGSVLSPYRLHLVTRPESASNPTVTALRDWIRNALEASSRQDAVAR